MQGFAAHRCRKAIMVEMNNLKWGEKKKKRNKNYTGEKNYRIKENGMHYWKGEKLCISYAKGGEIISRNRNNKYSHCTLGHDSCIIRNRVNNKQRKC